MWYNYSKYRISIFKPLLWCVPIFVTLHTPVLYITHHELHCLMFETQTTLMWWPLTQRVQKCYPSCPLPQARAGHNAHCLFLHNLHREKYLIHNTLQFSMQCRGWGEPLSVARNKLCQAPDNSWCSDICTQLDFSCFIPLLSPAWPVIGQYLSGLSLVHLSLWGWFREGMRGEPGAKTCLSGQGWPIRGPI